MTPPPGIPPPDIVAAIQKGLKISPSEAEPPQRSEFLNLLRISEFFGFQWQNLAEILSLLSEGQFDPIKG